MTAPLTLRQVLALPTGMVWCRLRGLLAGVRRGCVCRLPCAVVAALFGFAHLWPCGLCCMIRPVRCALRGRGCWVPVQWKTWLLLVALTTAVRRPW